MNRPSIQAERLWADLMALAAVTDPERPYTRRSFSPRFLEGRDWLWRRFETAGLTVRLDPAANLIGRRDGSNEAVGAIVLGSHSDTVPGGGRFDGPAGILAALEVARVLRESGRQLDHALEIVDFLAEEPSDYGVSCIGSRAMAGALDPHLLEFTNPAGETVAAAIDRIGGKSREIERARRDDIAAYLELHIEQGPVLESRNIDLGIVTGIVGIARIEFVFEGAADHAGTTPMGQRKDASVAAAQLVAGTAERGTAVARAGNGYFVATSGVFEIAPNATNVVPGHARVVFDIRAERDAVLSDFLTRLTEQSIRVADGTRTRARSMLLSHTKPAVFDGRLRQVFEASAAQLRLSTIPLASGAGHDAAFLSQIAPSAMLFIPCRGGKSHAPEEWSEPGAIAAGASTLLEAVLRLDSEGTV